MHERESSNFRPETPGSPRPNSLYNVMTTIDDLTLALANFSRVPSPEPPTVLECCCGKEDCANLAGWLDLKSRLESRLILSAEVGQALLQRHEAYVRCHETQVQHTRNLSGKVQGIDADAAPMIESAESEILALVKEKALLEKRLNQALINNEVTEASSKIILNELQEARATISRLTANHARSVGLENRLSAALKEKDDMQQERDSESNKAKLAESRFAAMKDKTAKLQSEVRRLQDVLEERRLYRLESSESILQDARARLDLLNKSQIGQTAMAEQAALTNVLESLVNDNDALKQDNAELRNLLAESREGIHLLQQEVEEHRANPPSRTGTGTPYLLPQTFSGNAPSSLLKEHTMRTSSPRSSSMEQRSRCSFEPLTPETSGRPLSPSDSLAPSEIKWTAFSQPQPRYPSSHISIEIEGFVDNDARLSSSPEKAHTHETSFSRSRGVQTEAWSGLASLYPVQSYLPPSSPHEPRSESSSFSDSSSSNLSVLLERMAILHNRLVQADALTLTNRLKRQHLKGADVGHLSRSTVSNILAEVTGLRTQFRFLMEDDRIITPCTRKDFRVFFKLFKDIFTEMGEMRVTLNDVVLDPAIASRVSEQVLHPSKVEAERREKEQDNTGSAAVSAWMAPISKLFQTRGDNSGGQSGIVRSASTRGRTRRFVPKLGPALSASATTVNVEFSGTGVGRPTTSTVASQALHDPCVPSENASTSQGISLGVMDIFAGAPRAPADPWVVLAKAPRRVHSFMQLANELSPPPPRRSANSGSMLSREVDAVIDGEGPLQHDEESDHVAPLLQRTLRHRGLSDSSIHSTFSSHADETWSPASGAVINSKISPRQDRTSVFRAFSKTMQNFGITAGTTSGAESRGSIPSFSPQRPSSHSRSQPRQARAPSPGHLHSLLPTLSAWAAAGSVLDINAGNDPFLPSSFRDPSLLQRTRLDARAHHDFF